MKKVWIWNHYATNMFFDQAGRHYWFSKYLIENGYKPTIFCASTNHFSDKNIDTKGKKYCVDSVKDIPFVFVNTPDYKGNGRKRIINMLAFYRNLFHVAKEYARLNGKPDVILASSVHPLTLVAGIKIAKKFGIPCICEVRDLWPESIFYFNKIKESSLLGRVLVKGEHWIYKKADALIFTKEGDTDYIKEKKWDVEQGGDIDLQKAHYINNGVDIEAFNKNINENKLEDPDLESGKFNVVYVGAIRPVNNVGAILDVAKLLRDYTDISFLIYGDGNQKEILENRVRDENISNVKIKGYVNKKYIPYILSKSSVNLLNYSNTQYNWTRGNSSNKLFEYMASGKPIISTVKMGYSLIKKYQCGVELESGSPEDLAQAILEIKNMPTEEYELLGENAKKGAGNFDFKSLTEKLIDVINNVV
jgi:glycosyltransferase involved in cell wall biosynthesis